MISYGNYTNIKRMKEMGGVGADDVPAFADCITGTLSFFAA
jgi:hypothetical protein